MSPNPASVDAPVSELDNLRWQQLESRLPGTSFVYGVTNWGGEQPWLPFSPPAP